jgi:hypothetical protein
MSDVKITIGADNQDAKKKIKEVESFMDLFSKNTQTAFKGVAIATGIATAAVVKGLQAYKEQEQATNALNQALINQGIYTKQLSDEYQSYATELQKTTTFADEAIVQAQATIQQYIGQEKVTKELTAAVLDYATKTGDLQGAAEKVGKSIGTNTNLLSRQGIEVDKTASKSEKLAQVVAGLNSKFEGQATAAAKGLGSLTQLSNAIGDVFEEIGKSAAPVVTLLAQSFTQLAVDITKSSSILNGMSAVFDFLGKEINSIVLAFKVMGAQIGIGLGTAVEAARLAITGQFSKAKDVVALGISEVKAVVAKAEADDLAFRKQVDQARQDQITGSLEEEKKKREAAAASKADAQARELLEEQERIANAELEKQNTRLLAAETERAFKNEENAAALELQIKQLDAQIQNEENAQMRIDLIKQRGLLVTKKIAQDEADFKKKQLDAQLVAFSGFFGNLASLQQSGSKELAKVGQAFAIFQATIDGYRAVVGAYANGASIGGPYLGAAFAAAAAIATAVQIRGIAAQKFADGGLVEGGLQGKDSVPAMLMPGELVVPRQNYDEVINAVASQRTGTPVGATASEGQMIQIMLGWSDDAFKIIEEKLIERRAIGVGV